MARPQALSPHYLSVGEQAVVSDTRPLDMAHLSRQTMGDRALEAEILSMFSKQLNSATGTLAKANGLERKRLAHSLKGTGRGVGAFALANIAERMELTPFDRAIIVELDLCIAQTCDFIASLNR
jgi:HPt (histidine-containing phosphotransfer) domain-containing protein